MIVCICANVSDSTIRKMLECNDLDNIKRITGACQKCCTCCKTLEKIAEETELLRLSNKLN